MPIADSIQSGKNAFSWSFIFLHSEFSQIKLMVVVIVLVGHKMTF